MWTIELTDLQGHSIDEVQNASDRNFTFTLNRIPTVQFKVRSDHPLVDPLMSADIYVKVYAGTTLMFHGIPTAVERVASGDTKSVSVTASGVLFRLTKRLAAKTPAGTVYTTPTDRGAIAAFVVEAANSEGDTGIRTANLEYLSYSTTTFKVEPYKPASEVIAELGQALDGFDWQVVPLEYTNGKIGDWQAMPVIGSQQDGAIFEYGTGANNIKDVQDQVSLDTMANAIYHLPPGGVSTSAAVISSKDQDSINERGLYEDVVNADISFPGARQSLVEEHVRVRRLPRRVLNFTPRGYHRDEPGNVPVFGEAYNVGDWVRAHGRDGDREWFDGYFRVYGVTVSLDRAGLESNQLILTDEG